MYDQFADLGDFEPHVISSDAPTEQVIEACKPLSSLAAGSEDSTLEPSNRAHPTYGLGMTITAQATVNVGASPQNVLEFALDLDQYRQVDPKILRVRSVEGPDDEGQGSVRIWGKVKGLPPAPDRQDFILEPCTKLTFFTSLSGT